jgi:hypothetical protein
LEKFSQDTVLRTEAQINRIKAGKFKKADRGRFFIFGAEIFGDLLKVKTKSEKIEGFFYLLTYLSMKMMT